MPVPAYPSHGFSYIQYLVAAKARLLALIIAQTCMAHEACMLKLVRDTCIDILMSFLPNSNTLNPSL